jgi:hypothetical protein
MIPSDYIESAMEIFRVAPESFESRLRISPPEYGTPGQAPGLIVYPFYFL